MAMREKLQRINDYEWLLPKSVRKEMRVDAKVIMNKALLGAGDGSAFEQLTNVATLPGVVEPVVGLPDMHWGYGLPMGAVSAFDEKEGIISAGLCGFDINCGVNLIRTNLTADEVRKHIKELVPALFKAIPCGSHPTGYGLEKLRLQPAELNEVLTRGVNWAVEKGYATKEDLEATEEHGCMEGADPPKISPLALKRGVPQLGTLGAGNHFLEIQEVSAILDPTTAKKWGIHSK